MAKDRILVVAPLLRSRRETTLQPAGEDARGVAQHVAREARVVLDEACLEAPIAARRAGGDVLFVALAEPRDAAEAARVLAGHDVAALFLEVAEASISRTEYRDPSGAATMVVEEPRLPATGDVDRLLDRLQALLDPAQGGASMVLVTDDVHGRKPVDFAERVVGRARGLGVPTMLLPSGASLKQSFHTQPFGAVLPAGELTLASPPDEAGKVETREESLSRTFEDPVRMLLLREEDGGVTVTVRGGAVRLEGAESVSDGALLGALAAVLLEEPRERRAAAWKDARAAAREGLQRLLRDAGARPRPRDAEAEAAVGAQ